MAFELHDMRKVCLAKVVTTPWVTKTVFLTEVVDYTHYNDSFEILQANQCQIF